MLSQLLQGMVGVMFVYILNNYTEYPSSPNHLLPYRQTQNHHVAHRRTDLRHPPYPTL
jgi:hypothetical protein